MGRQDTPYRQHIRYLKTPAICCNFNCTLKMSTCAQLERAREGRGEGDTLNERLQEKNHVNGLIWRACPGSSRSVAWGPNVGGFLHNLSRYLGSDNRNAIRSPRLPSPPCTGHEYSCRLESCDSCRFWQGLASSGFMPGRIYGVFTWSCKSYKRPSFAGVGLWYVKRGRDKGSSPYVSDPGHPACSWLNTTRKK